MASARAFPMIARNARKLTALALALAFGVSCGDAALEVVPYASVDQVFSEPIFRSFEEGSGIRVRAVFDTEETKSTGVLNRIIAEERAPQADVFWSGDPARAFVLIGRGLVEPYRSPNADRISPEFRSEDGMWTGFAARADRRPSPTPYLARPRCTRQRSSPCGARRPRRRFSTR